MDPRHHRASGGLLCSNQGYYGDCSGVGHKGPCSTENSYSTEERTRPISTVQDRSQDSSGLSLVDCPQATERFRSRHRGGPNTRTTYRRIAGQAREPYIQSQPIRLDEDQLTTDITDLEMTEKILDEGTAAFEDITQDCLVGQIKVADFEAYNKSLSEELEVLAKTKAVISEKTGGTELFSYGLTQTLFLHLFLSMLSSRGGLTGELTKSENPIGLTQLASRVVSTMHAETSDGDDPFAKVKGLT